MPDTSKLEKLNRELTAKANVCVLCCYTQNDSLVLKVEDDGAGYPLALVQNGPNPFETTSSNSSHFGMGLYSSRILCEKHGGRLILGNQAGGGASATAIFHFV